MKRIGLTGGIATGKSSVARMFADHGWSVIDADAIVHSLLGKGTPTAREIGKAFGKEVVNADGSIARTALGEIVFADASKRRKLEAITHPAVRHEMEKQADKYAKAGIKVCLFDIPLLFESNYDWRLDAIIVVTCDSATQIVRCKGKFGLNEADAKKRISAQLPLVEKVRRATFVIKNDRTLEETRKQVEVIAKSIIVNLSGQF